MTYMPPTRDELMAAVADPDPANPLSQAVADCITAYVDELEVADRQAWWLAQSACPQLLRRKSKHSPSSSPDAILNGSSRPALLFRRRTNPLLLFLFAWPHRPSHKAGPIAYAMRQCLLRPRTFLSWLGRATGENRLEAAERSRAARPQRGAADAYAHLPDPNLCCHSRRSARMLGVLQHTRFGSIGGKRQALVLAGPSRTISPAVFFDLNSAGMESMNMPILLLLAALS